MPLNKKGDFFVLLADSSTSCANYTGFEVE
jgi:hypothetical protein